MKKKTRVALLMPKPLAKDDSIAFVCSFCLGDSLIGLVTVNNLVKHGFNVQVFGDYAYQMKDWFPNYKIAPLLPLDLQQELKNYNVVLHMYESDLSKQVTTWHPNSITLSDSIHYLADQTMADIQAILCQKEFGFTTVERINRLQPLPGLIPRADQKRIVFHPTSSLKRKNWPAKKFLQLARKLQKENFECHFILPPQERKDWTWIESHGVHLPSFNSLNEVAKFIYESGYFIGNDSGLGHLASNLGVPTVSIILRKGVAKQWRPSWAPGKVVLSPAWLNPRPIKEKFWKIFTQVGHVKSAFDSLRREG